MNSLLTLADVSPLPLLVGGGVVLAAIAGVFLAFAAMVFGWIKRRRNRDSSTLSDEERSRFPDLE